jgi:NAD(P)-dependent dehydrogenase (short-subunit alcohol dehydrogenase family)
MLADKVVIVTGSSAGIGFAIARALRAERARVIVHGSSPAKVEEAARCLDGAPAIVADLADPTAASRIVHAALATYGRLDGLVNNAGIFPRGDIESTDAALFDRIFAINTRAPLLLARESVRVFRQQKSPGSIVTIGSINAHCGQSDLLPYSMSKGALITMTRNLGDALAPERIRVNLLNVGWTVTETEKSVQRAEGRPDDWYKKVSPVFAPTGQLLSPEMIAPHVLFWLSEASAPVTGQVYEVEQYPVIGRNRINES